MLEIENVWETAKDFCLLDHQKTEAMPLKMMTLYSCYQEKTLLTSSVQENSLDFIEEESKHEGDLSRGHVDQVEKVSSDVEHLSERSFDSYVAHPRATSTMIHEWTGNKPQKKHRIQGSNSHSNRTRRESKSSRKYRRKEENEFQIKYGLGHADREDVQFQTEGLWERSTEAESSRNLSGLDSYHHLKIRGSMEALQPCHSQSEMIDDYHHISNPRDRLSPQTTPKLSTNSRQNGRKFTSRTPDREGVYGRVPSNKQDETLEKLNGFDIYQEPTSSNVHRHKGDVESKRFLHHNFPHKFHAERYPTFNPDSMELEIEATTAKRTNNFDLEEFYNPYGSSVLENNFYTGKGILGQGPDTPTQLLETDLPPTDTTTELLDRFGVVTGEKYLQPSFSSDLSFSDDFMSNSLREILYSKDNLMSTFDTEALSSIPEETESFSETNPASSNLPQNRINSDGPSIINLCFSSVDEHGREVEQHNNRHSGKKVSRMAVEGESDNKIKIRNDEDDVTEILCDDTLAMLDQVSQDDFTSEELRKVLKKRYKPTDKQFFRSTDGFDEDVSQEGSLSVQSLGTDQNGKFEIECPVSGHYADLDNYLDTVTLSHSSREWEMVGSHPPVDMERQVEERRTVLGTSVRSDELSDPIDSILLKERSSFIDPALFKPNCILSNSDEIYDLLRNIRPENKQLNEGLGDNHSLPFSVPNSSTDLSNMDSLQSKPMQTSSVFHKEQIATSSYALSSPESSHLLESNAQYLTQGTKLEEEKEVNTSRRIKESFPRDSKSVAAERVPNEGQISDQMSKSLAAFKELPTFNQNSVVAVTTQCNVRQAQLRHFQESDQNSEPIVPKQPENTMQSSNKVDDILVKHYFDATETVTSQTLSSARRKDARDAFNLVSMLDDDSFRDDGKGYIEGNSHHVINTSTHSLLSGTVQERHLSDLEEVSSITGGHSLHLSELEDYSKNIGVSGHSRDVIHSPVIGRGAGVDEEGNCVVTRKKQDVPHGRSKALDGDRSLHIDELAVNFNRDAYSLPSKQITRDRHRPYTNGIGREMNRQSESVNLRSEQMDFEGRPEMKKMSYSLTLPKVQASPKRSILQDVSLLSGVGWTVRVRNVLRQTPKKNHSDLVAKAYWMKRWRIGTRVQKMIRLDEESQMQSAILFHDISLLYKYLTTWRQITREKLQQASDLYRRNLLTQGINAMKRAVSQSRNLTEQLRGRLQQGQLRSSFCKWHSRTRLHQHHEQVAQLCFSRKSLRYMFLKWRVVYASRQKDRVASLHFKLCLLSTFFLKWKVFVSDRRVKHEQGELARVYREENLLKASWDTLKETYHKRMAANRQDRRYTLVKVMRAWRHGAQLCRMETIQLHQRAQGLRRVHLLRVHLLSWKEEVIVSKAERKIDRVKLCFAFCLWKLKLERKRLVNRIIASKRRRAIKLRVLTLWRQETINNREQRSQGVRVLQNFQKRRFFEAWRLLLQHNKERRGKLEDRIKMSKVTSMKKYFRQWMIKYNEKKRSHMEEEVRRRWLAEKFTARWRQVVKMRREEIKADLFKETKRKKCLKVAFGTWIDAFSAALDEQEKAMEARGYIEKHKLHRLFRCWRLAAREGVVIRPLVDRRRKKHLQRAFSSWILLIQRKRMVKLMQEQSNRRMVTLSYFGWRQNYLEVLQLKVAKETLIQKHLSRLLRAWYLVGRNRKEAERLILQRDQRILARCFEVWRSKQEEADLKLERLKGHQMRSVLLKRFYFRLWTERKRTGRKEESEAIAGVKERRNVHSLRAAFRKWKSSYENEILARNHHLAVVQANFRILLRQWHQHAKLSFQHSLEVFTRSLGLSSPYFGTITPSDLSRRAQASEGSNYSDTVHLSVVDSGYHGNHANLESLSIGRFQNLSQSDFVDASNPSDLETISIQSCPLFPGTTAPSVMEDDGTFQSTEIAHTFSSADSSPDSKLQLERRDTPKPPLNQMDESYSQRIEGCPSAQEEVKEMNGDTDGSTEYEYSYPITGMTGTFSQGWRQHSSEGDSSHPSSLRLGCSDDDSRSSSSCELVTVQDRLSTNNVMRDVWLGEMGDVLVGEVSDAVEDEDSLGMMSLRELVDEDTALTRSDCLETLSSFHDENDDEDCVTEEQQSKVVLIKYMLNFWRLWPVSAVFLQWLRYTRYRKYLRLQQDELKKITMRNTLRRYTNHWRRQLKLVQIADQHQKSSLIGKYFEALSTHHQRKKKSRLNRELAERWRAVKSLSAPFQKWKSQVLYAHTLSGEEPSWDSFITKSRTLCYNSSKLEGKIQKENMNECFMFWKLRVWQQLQVRNQFQQTLKQRCFQSWLQWTRVNIERTIQMESFLQRRQKHMVLLRWKEALLHKSKVQQMRSKVNENHLRDILHLWHQYAQRTREDREHTETAQSMVAMTALQHFWNIWRCQLKECIVAQSFRDQQLTKKCFGLWLNFKHQQIELRKSARKVEVIVEERESREAFYIWRKRMEAKKRMLKLTINQEQTTLRISFEKWKEYVSLERREKMRCHNLMEEVVSHWLMVCHLQQKQRMAIQDAVSRWRRLVHKSRNLSRLQQDRTRLKSRNRLEQCWKIWREKFDKTSVADRFYESHLCSRYLHDWCIYTKQQKRRLADEESFRLRMQHQMVERCFSHWMDMSHDIQQKQQISDDFAGQRSQRTLTVCFQMWLQQTLTKKADNFYKAKVEKQMWSTWKVALMNIQIMRQVQESTERRRLQTSFNALQIWCSENKKQRLLIQSIRVKQERNRVRFAFSKWREQMDQRRNAGSSYHKHQLRRHFQAWLHTMQKEKHLQELYENALATFTYRRIQLVLYGKHDMIKYDREVLRRNASGHPSDKIISICFERWKSRTTQRGKERLRLFSLAQSAAAHWRWWVEKRQQYRRIEREKEQKAEAFSRRCLSLHVIKCWKKGVEQQKQERQRKNWLLQKYGRKWMNLTSQRIVAEQMEHYWKMRRGWNQWRQHLIKSLTSKKFNKNEERRLCAKVFNAWKMAAKHDLQYYIEE
ncbi:uncharacterized protein [Apostichopus japonicus]|uniref:uncharacterized protein isoform X2 n=1 Tax=Stichopus japonicus TaxID=307972 RepID=UPI003AB1208A